MVPGPSIGSNVPRPKAGVQRHEPHYDKSCLVRGSPRLLEISAMLECCKASGRYARRRVGQWIFVMRD